MVMTSSFDKLLLYVGFTLSAFAVLTVVGMMLLRIKRPHSRRPYKTYGYPITPILFILTNLWILIFSVKCNPMVSLYGAMTIITGILVYHCFRRTQTNKS